MTKTCEKIGILKETTANWGLTRSQCAFNAIKIKDGELGI